MNNDQNKGVTGVAKTGTGILGNTVSGVSNTLGGVVGMFFLPFFYRLFKFRILFLFRPHGSMAACASSL